jgi:Carboxypeptidase regulatory-like domain
MRNRIVSAVVVLILLLPVLARDKKPAAPSSVLTFLILKDYNGKPLRNAAVVLHPVNSRDKQQNGGLELKTDSDGHASYDGIPYGKLRVQVLAPGFQTFGEDYDINQPTFDVTVKMKRPAGQYSIYEEHPEEKKETPPDTQPKP